MPETPRQRNARIIAETNATDPLDRDEPVFVIRARDDLALTVIDFYAQRADIAQLGESFLAHMLSVRNEFLDWRATHRAETRLPDVRP